MDILTLRMTIPIIAEFVPKRWDQSIHVMIPKDEYKYNVDRLRDIQLLEPDLNAVLKIKVNQVIKQDKEIQKGLGTDMYGFHPNNSTQYDLFHQNMTLDIHQQQYNKVTLLNLDASKFFDRIFTNIANISLQGIGVNKKITTIFSKKAHTMTHRINTSYGISHTNISAPNNKLWSGVDQVNAAADPRWISIERIILSAWNTFIPPEIVYNPTYSRPHASNVIAYVDDNNILSSYPKSTPQQQIKQKTFHKYHTWKKLLETTGGELNETKQQHMHGNGKINRIKTYVKTYHGITFVLDCIIIQ